MERNEISPVHARLVAGELARRGLPPAPLFAGTSLDFKRLETADSVSTEDFSLLLSNARRLSGDDRLGLVIGRSTSFMALGPAGVALMAAPTLREGLQVLEHFSRLYASCVELRVDADIGGLSVGLKFNGVRAEVERFLVEASFMLLQNVAATMNGGRARGVRFRMGFEQPRYAHAYADSLHGRVEFNRLQHAVDLPLECLDKPSPFFNGAIWQQAADQLAQRLRELKDSQDDAYTRHVAALLRSALPPLPDLATLAERLQVSERTLNRRLQEENTNFRELRSAELRRWSKRYLDQSELSVDAISALLGYRDAANFRRAFRNWERRSPREYRSRGQGLQQPVTLQLA